MDRGTEHEKGRGEKQSNNLAPPALVVGAV